MKRLSVIILFILTNYSNGQDTLRHKKLYVGAFLSPDCSYRVLPNNTGTAATVSHVRDLIEIPRFAYTLGLDFLYQPFKRIALSLGIQYSLKGEQTKNTVYSYGTVQPRRGFQSIPFPTNGYFIYNDNYIDIPISANFSFKSKTKTSFFIMAGISTNIFLSEKVVSEQTYSTGNKVISSKNGSSGYYKINSQLQLGCGFDINIKKNKLRIYPIGRISILPVNSGPVNGYFYSIGLGVSYLFQVHNSFFNN